MPARWFERKMACRWPMMPRPALFQGWQAAGLQHHVVALILATSPLGRYGKHLVQPHAQHFGRGLALALQLVLDLLGRVERIPQGVDLVEHHQPRVGPLASLPDARARCSGSERVTPVSAPG